MNINDIYYAQQAIDSTRYNQICRDFKPLFAALQGLKAPSK